ncbi:MAG: DUF4271 domain-containing protein [Bacteroidetes bacterium]|nr:DUF4271 domain-containing protein [Bacteroidota bacterium]
MRWSVSAICLFLFCFNAGAQDTLIGDSFPVDLKNAVIVLGSDTIDQAAIDFVFPVDIGFSIPEVVSIRHVEPLIVRQESNWIFYLILLLLVLLAYIRINYDKELSDLIGAVSSVNLAHQLQREQEMNVPVSSIMLNILFVLSSSVYLYLIIDDKIVLYREEELFVFLLVCLSGLSLLKFFSLRFTGLIFPFRNEIRFFNFNILLLMKVLGVILIPFIIVLSYAPVVVASIALYSSLFLILLSIVLLYIRGLAIGKEYILVRKFHFFIYLCTLEIAPMLIVFEGIDRWIIQQPQLY